MPDAAGRYGPPADRRCRRGVPAAARAIRIGPTRQKRRARLLRDCLGVAGFDRERLRRAAPVMRENGAARFSPSHRPDDMRIVDASPPSRREHGPWVANGLAPMAGVPSLNRIACAAKRESAAVPACVIVRQPCPVSLPGAAAARRTIAATRCDRRRGRRPRRAAGSGRCHDAPKAIEPAPVHCRRASPLAA